MTGAVSNDPFYPIRTNLMTSEFEEENKEVIEK